MIFHCSFAFMFFFLWSKNKLDDGWCRKNNISVRVQDRQWSEKGKFSKYKLYATAECVKPMRYMIFQPFIIYYAALYIQTILLLTFCKDRI